jgi:hypothetical protein
MHFQNKFAQFKSFKVKYHDNLFLSKLDAAFLQSKSTCVWQAQRGINLGAKVFCWLHGATTVHGAGKQRVVWQTLFNAISGEGRKHLTG